LFTTSGNSENIFRALVAAKELKLKTIAFLGRDGGECASLADVELSVGGKLTAHSGRAQIPAAHHLRIRR
jgi:D-sedoheptulose 7-phosphate isomerase